MYGVIPNQNVGIRAFIPICESNNTQVHPSIHIVPGGHVFKENKLKIAKHCGNLPLRFQGSITDLSKKYLGGMVSCNADTYPSYSHALTKKRKAHEANLHLHDDSSAPQIQCRYAPPSPVGLPQGTGARIALRNSTIPAKQVHHVPDCTTGLIVPGSSGSIPTFTNYANQTAVAASKTCPKPAAAQGDYAIVVGEMLRSSNESYEVLAFLGRGTFGQVVKCRCSSTKRCVAIKILKNLPSYLRQGNVEIQILQTLSQQDTESHNIVRAIECFQHKNHMCFVFELLEQNLYEYLKSNKFRPLSLLEIRPITQQVLTALSKLKSLGLIHADLKPENIMLVSSTTGIMRYRVKVIDFGSACHSSKAVQNTYLQSRYYRAPEILLGLPFNEAIDMWSLGCVIAELFLGWPLYPGSSEYDQMRYIVETQGPPPPDLLQNAGKCSTFFIRDPYHCDWRLKTQEEYTLETGQQAKEARKYFFTSLSQICEVPGVPSPSDPDRELDIEDRQQFASLLSLMLKMRPSERVVPDSALLHPFITMLHLQAYPFSKRFHESLTLMQVCHEATRRQHLLSARSNLQQFSSLPSLHEHSSTGIISTAPSPDSSTTKALLGPEASISLPHTSMCHPSGSAVAYYAAAAVAAALTKPASQSVVEERMFSDPNNLRHYRMPNLVNDTNQQSSVTIFNNTQSCATAMEPSPTTVFLAHPKADVYQSTQDVHSGFLGNRVSVPYSLSLYDLVAASGNALSLLNAVAAPVSSNFVAASVSNHQRVSSHSSRGCLYQLRQPPINRSELDPRLPAEQAEEAALVLSSYIGQEQSQLHRCEPYISVNVAPTTVSSTSLETVDLRDRLNAFVQQQQQQHQQQQQQQQLYRNPAAAFVAVQQRQQQQQPQQHHILSSHQPQEPILFAPSAAELNSLHVTNPYQTGLLPRTRALVQCSVPTSQQRIQFHQAKQRQTAVNFQSIPATRVVATHLLSGSRLQPQAGIVKPIYTAAIPLMSNPAVYVQELPQNYTTLLQQQPHHHGPKITPSYPRSASPSSTMARNNQLLTATDQTLPINLVTSAELDIGRERPPITPETSKWAPDLVSDYSTTQLRLTPERVNDSRPKSIPSLSGAECSHVNACCQSCAVISSATTTRFETSDGENHLATSVESSLSECVQPTTFQNSTANTTSTTASSNPEKLAGLNSSDCKSNIESNLSTVSSASSLRSEKKIPVGRVQPMIKQEDCSSSTCFLPSPTLNYMSGNFRNTAGTSIYNDGATQRRIPPHCITRNSYHSGQPMSPDRPSIVTAPSTSSTRSSLRKQSRLSFSPSDTESQTAHHLSAAHAAAAAYHNLMYFQLQQQQQHQQHRNQVPAVNFPTMPAIHLRASHHCAVPQPNTVQLPIVNDAWPTTASMPELDDSTAAAASYYAAAAAAAAAAVAQREQQQQQEQQHRQELELLLNQHAAQFHPHQLSAVAAAGDQHHHLSAQLFRQQ